MRFLKGGKYIVESVKTVEGMKEISEKCLKESKTIGFVPTMGYLHEGHISLIKRAREENDTVVVSIFVNPIQFGPTEDLSSYPRDINRDLKISDENKVDYVFLPTVDEMYPGPYHTYVEVEKLTEHLCGAKRPGHFRGVTTVVLKLFNIVKPTRAYFGQKDAQQFRVLRSMVKDLNLDVEMVEMPIVREKDGVALSSRNKYLSPEERREAVCLSESLRSAITLIENGERDTNNIIASMKSNINRYSRAKIDYIEIVDEQELQPIKDLKGKFIIALAVYIGRARLIDNVILSV